MYKDRGRTIEEDKKKFLADKGLPNSYKVLSFADAYPFYYINNLRGESEVSIDFEFKKMKGIEYLNTRGKKVKFSVKPKQEGIVLMKREQAYAISYSESLSVKRGAQDLAALAKKNGVSQSFKKDRSVVVK